MELVCPPTSGQRTQMMSETKEGACGVLALGQGHVGDTQDHWNSSIPQRHRGLCIVVEELGNWSIKCDTSVCQAQGGCPEW